MSKSGIQKTVVFTIIATVFLGLFAMVPYATGYGSERRPVVYWLWHFWRSPEWQHGALVPFIIGAILWTKRAMIRNLKIQGSTVGLLLIVFSLVFFFAGHRANLYYLGFASCHLLVIGMVLWFFGWQAIKKLAFPLCFLVFMWPLYFLESQIGFPLRMLMTHLSSGILHFVGVDHLMLGTALVSAANNVEGIEQGSRFALEVANPCSGIRSLFALMMVGGIFGYLTLRKSWQWSLMCLSAIPCAIAGNVARILILTGGSIAFGSDVAVGVKGETSTFHFIAGLAVFAVALGGLFAIGKLLNYRKRPRTESELTGPVALQTEA